MNVIKIKNEVRTSFSGYKSLIEFYNQASQYKNEVVAIDFYHMDWFDANLCSLFEAILYKLNKENGLNFTTDYKYLLDKFSVLFRNGFIKSEIKIEDVQKSTLPTKSFPINAKDDFLNYIENDLMKHRAMPKISDELKGQITDDLIEIFSNTNYHAKTEEPFFVGGQYYPSQGYLILTMVDLGAGFLPAIEKTTNGKVKTSIEAIKWALQGNSTKQEVPGGLGIKNILKYCVENKGIFQIVSGDAFWGTDLENTIFQGSKEVENPFCGTTINLFFNCG